jgi:hypothetical protein
MWRSNPNINSPRLRAGRNGSMQHQLQLHVPEPAKLNSFRDADVNGTLHCLGSD